LWIKNIKVQEDRYNSIHTWGTVQFSMTDFYPQEDECKYLLMKIVEQAIRDYINLEKCIVPTEVQYYESSQDFLFDDECRIQYGDFLLSFTDILHTLGLEVDWFRKKVIELKRTKSEVPDMATALYKKKRK